jgi:P pilus assembly chaperone PapD
MPRSRLRRASLLGLVLGLALCQADPARASAFTVHPIRVVFSPDTRSALLTLHNQSSEALRFQLSVFAWDQSPIARCSSPPATTSSFSPPC